MERIKRIYADFFLSERILQSSNDSLIILKLIRGHPPDPLQSAFHSSLKPCNEIE